MATGKKVFIIGPGFIGLNVLDNLVAEGYSVTGLVRRDDHAKGIEASGAAVVRGTLNDHDLIRKCVAESDITFHTATADHLPSVEAVLDGVRQRATVGKDSIFIHTSGTGVLDDGAKGQFKNDKIYYDDKPDEIDSLGDDAPHRPVDLTIIRARKELSSKAKIAIMVPPEIYGFNAKHKRLTIQIPTIARFAIKHGFAPYIGEGLSVESQIYVADLARAYIVLLHWMEEADASAVLPNPYFFCENGKEFSWKEVAENVAKPLHIKGVIKDPVSHTAPEHLYKDLFGDDTALTIGINSRSRAVRLRKLGWEAREKGIWQSWEEDELPELLKEKGLGTSSVYRPVGG